MKRTSPYQKQAAEWVIYGENDFKAAKENFKLGNFPLVCYLCQQTAEKFLKAFLISKGVKPPRTHLLQELADRCQKVNPNFKRIKNYAKKLEEYYIPTRYPVGVNLSDYTKAEAQSALNLAKIIIDFIKKLFK
jgi:HEPN domain-containing protein